jgi:hypothetical protein
LTGDKIPDFFPDFRDFCEIQGLFPTVMARLSTASSFFLSQIGVREFLPDININSNILTEESVVTFYSL